VHADPHPGNFLVNTENQLVALDFGCMKKIPNDFYNPYFELVNKKIIDNKMLFEEILFELEILRTDDSQEEIEYFSQMFYDLLSLFTKPFQSATFDFSDEAFFQNIAKLGERFTKDTTLRKMNGNRVSKHFIYMNRTFFGLYNLMFDLKAKIVVIEQQAAHIRRSFMFNIQEATGGRLDVRKYYRPEDADFAPGVSVWLPASPGPNRRPVS